MHLNSCYIEKVNCDISTRLFPLIWCSSFGGWTGRMRGGGGGCVYNRRLSDWFVHRESIHLFFSSSKVINNGWLMIDVERPKASSSPYSHFFPLHFALKVFNGSVPFLPGPPLPLLLFAILALRIRLSLALRMGTKPTSLLPATIPVAPLLGIR